MAVEVTIQTALLAELRPTELATELVWRLVLDSSCLVLQDQEEAAEILLRHLRSESTSAARP